MYRLLLALALLAAAPALARAADIPERTLRLSLGVNGSDPRGDSSRPSISGDGRLVVFDSTAPNLALDRNGRVRDIFLRDTRFGFTTLISQGLGGEPADGPSRAPVIAGRANVIAFLSDATNLVEGDSNGIRDVFVRRGSGAIERVSVAPDGTQADGASRDLDISADGRRLVFASSATNLVEGDVEGFEDVFVRDLPSGLTFRVSQRDGAGGNGPSRAPAISPDGRYVSFYSEASNLVDGDTNGVGDVFVADLKTGFIGRVSVNDRGRQQNKAVMKPFVQVSDISRGGRYVVFDSDATNLARGDRRGHTDVFLHDTRRHKTGRLSVDRFLKELNSDSVYPTITPDGMHVAFQSFATNLAPGAGPRENVYVFDMRRTAATVLGVGLGGRSRARERTQLLQRPVLSDDGTRAAFTSTAGNLVRGDRNGVEDVFMRVLAAPRARWVQAPAAVERTPTPSYRIATDDRRATDLLCELSRIPFKKVRIPCGRAGRLPFLPPGRYRLEVRAGGPGMLFQAKPLVRRFTVAY